VENSNVKLARLTAVTFLSLTLVMPASYAAGPLPPGKPAGVKQADLWDLTTLGVITLGAAMIVGFSLAITSTTPPPATSISGGSGGSLTVSPTTTQ
jgi:hypothetical protein